VANLLQTEAWSVPALGGERTDSIVCALPLYHIFALTACAMWGTRVGALNILIPNPRDIGGFIKELAKYKFNMLPAVNTLYNALLNHPDFAKLDFSGLKICNGGGMAVQQAVNDRWLKVTGVPSSKATACPRLRRWPPATVPTARRLPAPSACRCRRPILPSSMTTARKCRWASRAKSRSAVRR
jgi:acyl-CoA synthetase (AMP-forming)/AMP-acid ligase II